MDDSQKQPRKKWQRRSFKVTPPSSEEESIAYRMPYMLPIAIWGSFALGFAVHMALDDEDDDSEEGSSAPVWVYNPILHHITPPEKVSTPMRASEPPVWYVQGGYHSRHSQLYVKSATAGKRSSAVRGGFSLFSKGAGS